MSDKEDFVEDERPKSKDQHRNMEEVTNADLFSLLKTYMNDKLSGIEDNFKSTAENLAKKAKKSEPTFKFKGNQVQFELNAEISDELNDAIHYIQSDQSRKAVKVLQEAVSALKKRNKLIRIADKSDGGWKTVDEYLSDEVASDSEDEKRIRAADNRAVKKLKTSKKDGKGNKKIPAESAATPNQIAHNGGTSGPSQPFRGAGAVASAQHNNKAKDYCYNCGMYGHWARDCRKPVNNNIRIGTSRGAAV